jgi:hypothetical protein
MPAPFLNLLTEAIEADPQSLVAAVKSEPGPPMTLAGPAVARIRLKPAWSIG